MPGPGDIHKYVRPAGLQAEGLRVSSQLDVGDLRAVSCVEHAERAAAMTDIDFFGGFIVTNVVSIIAQFDRADGFEGMAVENPAGPVRAVGDEKPVEFR